MKSEMAARNSVRLSTVQSGEWVRILDLEGGHCFLSRLASLGFTPGTHIKVVQNFGHGPIIVSLRETRVALGRGEASKILIERPSREGDARRN